MRKRRQILTLNLLEIESMSKKKIHLKLGYNKKKKTA